MEEQDLLSGYHKNTSWRLEIAKFNLHLLLKNYNNSVAFDAGFFGFLAQSVSALGSLANEIFLRYEIPKTNKGDFVEDMTTLYGKLGVVVKKNPDLKEFLDGVYKSEWYKRLKHWRDRDGIHRLRTGRHLVHVGGALTIRLEGIDIGPFCETVYQEVTKTIDECHKLMGMND